MSNPKTLRDKLNGSIAHDEDERNYVEFER